MNHLKGEKSRETLQYLCNQNIEITKVLFIHFFIDDSN